MRPSGRSPAAAGADDPRSPTPTVGAAGSGAGRRALGLDQWYVAWKPLSGVTVTDGKMAYPLFRPGQSVITDGDVNPEGVVLNYQHGIFFGNAYGLWLTERGTATVTDGVVTGTISPQQQGSTYSGVQFGVKVPFGADTGLTAAAMYSRCVGCQGRQPYWLDPSKAPTAAQVNAGGATLAAALVSQLKSSANGNTVDANGSLLYAYNQTEGALELNTKLIGLPLMAFANDVKNDGAKNGQDQAYTVGLLVGKANDVNTREIGDAYEKLEKDAYYGGFVDSDFAGGSTDAKGSVVRAAYAPAKNWPLNATYFINILNNFSAASASTPRDESYKRLQIDVNVKF